MIALSKNFGDKQQSFASLFRKYLFDLFYCQGNPKPKEKINLIVSSTVNKCNVLFCQSMEEDILIKHHCINFITMQENHVMKFVHGGNTAPLRGIKTFPHQSHGVSLQSPDHFQRPHALVHQGYHYRHEHAPTFEYHSQKKSLQLDHDHTIPVVHDNSPHRDMNKNPKRFHLKKGRLTEFWDKNSWMKTVYLMSGKERSERSRQLNQKDVDFKKSVFPKRPQYQPETQRPHINQSYFKTLEDIMSQKLRIRNSRNKQAQRRLSNRTLSEKVPSHQLQSESIKQKMATTARQWQSKRSSKRNLSRQLSLREDNKRQRNQQAEFNLQNLQDWQRKTCNTKWCYKRPMDDPFLEEEAIK